MAKHVLSKAQRAMPKALPLDPTLVTEECVITSRLFVTRPRRFAAPALSASMGIASAKQEQALVLRSARAIGLT